MVGKSKNKICDCNRALRFMRLFQSTREGEIDDNDTAKYASQSEISIVPCICLAFCVAYRVSSSSGFFPNSVSVHFDFFFSFVIF